MDYEPAIVLNKMLVQEHAKATAQNRESVYEKIIPLELSHTDKAAKRKAKAQAQAEADSNEEPPFTPGSVGNDRLHAIQAQIKKRPGGLLKSGDVLANGAVVKSPVPKSIGGPAAESFASQAAEKKAREEAEAKAKAIAEREAAVR